MPEPDKRVDRHLVPGLEVGEDVARRIGLCLRRDRTGVAAHCIGQLRLVGRFGDRLLADPGLVEKVVANPAVVGSDSPVVSLARWLHEGSGGPVRIRIAPFTVEMDRGAGDDALRIVAILGPDRDRRGAGGCDLDGLVPAPASNDDSPRSCKLEIDIACALAAVEAMDEIADPYSLSVLRSIVGMIYVSVARAGLILEGKQIGPGLRPDLVQAVIEDFRSMDRKTIKVDALGLEVSFELTACELTGLPFRFTAIRDGEDTAPRTAAEIRPLGPRSVRSRDGQVSGGRERTETRNRHWWH